MSVNLDAMKTLADGMAGTPIGEAFTAMINEIEEARKTHDLVAEALVSQGIETAVRAGAAPAKASTLWGVYFTPEAEALYERLGKRTVTVMRKAGEGVPE